MFFLIERKNHAIHQVRALKCFSTVTGDYSLIDGQHDGQGVGEVGGGGEHVGTFVQSLLHHAVLLDVQVEDSLLQIPHTSVDQLRTATARARGEVIQFHERSLQTCVINHIQLNIANTVYT